MDTVLDIVTSLEEIKKTTIFNCKGTQAHRKLIKNKIEKAQYQEGKNKET